MSPITIDPNLVITPESPLVHLNSPQDTESLRHGDLVESWDYVFEWDEDCLTASQLEE
jgi:hypothetical protein